MIKKIVKKVIPISIRENLRKMEWVLKSIIVYPFKGMQERAYIRWRLSKGEKKRYIYNLNEESIVFDVGGYIGDFSDNIVQKYNSKIYIFEPIREYANKIEERFCDNEKVNVYEFGLSDLSTTEEMYLCEDGSSVFEGHANTEIEEVRMKSIVEFMDENKISKIDLLKLNIEGGEYAVLDSLFNSAYINKVRYIQIQFHDVSEDSVNKMKRQIKELQRSHTLMWKCRPFIWESWKIKEKECTNEEI